LYKELEFLELHLYIVLNFRRSIAMEKVGKTGSEITKNVDELVRLFLTIPDDWLYVYGAICP
jgi:hypothetical protein